mgnify:CR=1 FL=1|jgi:ribosomal protein S24E
MALECEFSCCAVLSASNEANMVNRITLHNPFGKTEEYVFALIYSDINQIGHLDKWQKYGDPV